MRSVLRASHCSDSTVVHLSPCKLNALGIFSNYIAQLTTQALLYYNIVCSIKPFMTPQFEREKSLSWARMNLDDSEFLRICRKRSVDLIVPFNSGPPSFLVVVNNLQKCACIYLTCEGVIFMHFPS